jgi:hypothetical protein
LLEDAQKPDGQGADFGDDGEQPGDPGSIPAGQPAPKTPGEQSDNESQPEAPKPRRKSNASSASGNLTARAKAKAAAAKAKATTADLKATKAMLSTKEKEMKELRIGAESMGLDHMKVTECECECKYGWGVGGGRVWVHEWGVHLTLH